ncbi:MAG TPA: hypothetical protein VGR13_08900 [Actinomycetota bacterium]|nr:hypothetical protein [Actinomycetota bacterium]
MEAIEGAPHASPSLEHGAPKLFQELATALIPRQLARSLVVPLLVFWVAATIALAVDRGYELELVGVVVLLVSRAAYRAGVREREQ